MKIGTALALIIVVFHTFGVLAHAADDSDAGQHRIGGPPAPQPDPTGIDKCRFISMVTPGSGVSALRVNLTSLHHVDPPYTGAVTVAFTAFEGLSVWVGPPAQYVESQASQIPFYASMTSCTPHYQDWSTVGLLHVTGSAIAPSSIYHIETLDAVCQGVEGSVDCQAGGANVSSQLEIRTTRWGDMEVLFNPPSAARQPDASDMSAFEKKFRDMPNSLIKARAIISGQDAFGSVNVATLANDVSLSHIASCFDAFRGNAYPFKMGKCMIGPGACTTNADCTGANAPPCNLYCP